MESPLELWNLNWFFNPIFICRIFADNLVQVALHLRVRKTQVEILVFDAGILVFSIFHRSSLRSSS